MSEKFDCNFLCICFIIDKKIYLKNKLFEQINDILVNAEKNYKIKLNFKKQKNEIIQYFTPIGKPFIGFVREDSKDIMLSVRWKM